MKPVKIEGSDYQALARLARQIDFFSPLTNTQLDMLMSNIQLYEFKSGETVFKKGAPSDAFYIVYEGHASVEVGRRLMGLLAKKVELRPGSLFGEMGLLERSPRTATVKADTKSKIFVLLREFFDGLVKENPTFAKYLYDVASRRAFEATHNENS